MNEFESNVRIEAKSLNENIYTTIVDPLVQSLDYRYTGSVLEEAVPVIPFLVHERVNNLGSERFFVEERKNCLRELSPANMSINKYYYLLREAYNQKIETQQKIRSINQDYQFGNIGYDVLVHTGEELLKVNALIEPKFFAITDLAKSHVDTELVKIKNKYGDFLSTDEISLLSVPSLTNFFTKRFLDVQEFLLNSSTNNKNILEKRYGRLFFKTDWFKKQKLDITMKERVEEIESKRSNDKKYLLVERRIPNAITVDNILIMDHVIDKFIQQNNSFLHDIFLEMQILNPFDKISEMQDLPEIKELELQAIDYLLQN